jgi:hypothetical protein
MMLAGIDKNSCFIDLDRDRGIIRGCYFSA